MSKTEHDFKFSKLDVDWVVVLAEEDFHIVLEHIWPFLNNEQYVTQCDILNFRSGRK